MTQPTTDSKTTAQQPESREITLTREQWTKIDNAAKRLEVTPSALIERLLQRFFDNPAC